MPAQPPIDPPEPFNLLRDKWLPTLRASGTRDVVSVAELTSGWESDPIVAVDLPRPDLVIAVIELLIATLTTLLRPGDIREWRARWCQPPTQQALQAALDIHLAAFFLDGSGPRFLQELGGLQGEILPIERLLIDSPGQNAIARNTDLIVRRGRLSKVSRATAACMLYALQAFAPAGGAGHRTSLRGGGPLTSLVLPACGPQGRRLSLWHWLWANVTVGPSPAPEAAPLVFPWLAPTRVSSDKSGGTVLDGKDGHPLQALWGMPRRIWLEFQAMPEPTACDLTGSMDDVMVVGFRTLPYGVQYLSAPHLHPLTPVYFPKVGAAPLAVHPQPEGIGYRHWHDLLTEDGRRAKPATVVERFVADACDLADRGWWEDASIAIYGFDMDNAKARAFVETRMPMLLTPRQDVRQELLGLGRRLAEGATQAANLLRAQVRSALADDAKLEATLLSAVRERFFDRTTSAFWDTLGKARTEFEQDANVNPDAHCKDWLTTVKQHAMAIFDEFVVFDPLSPTATGRMQDGKWQPPPAVAARRHLGVALAGHGKWGEGLFNALGLPAVAPAKRKTKKEATA